MAALKPENSNIEIAFGAVLVMVDETYEITECHDIIDQRDADRILSPESPKDE